MWFQVDEGLSKELLIAAGKCGISSSEFSPDIRLADRKFGDFQANGVMTYAKSHRLNPRILADEICQSLNTDNFSQIEVSVSGPGFINFKLTDEFLVKWINTYKSFSDFTSAAKKKLRGKRIILDYSSPNTAKQMHVGHLRSMNIGNSIYRILKFCGADVVRDNHIGDWGTQFGIIIMAIKRKNVDYRTLSIDEIEEIYKYGYTLSKEDSSAADMARRELVKLQNGDPENIKIWEAINLLSQSSFDEIYQMMGIEFDYTLGESFYRDQVDRVYEELIAANIAREDDGALCVFFENHEKFLKQPFLIRKRDGASNYAATDLATILYRTEHFHADEIIYVTDGRQQDHFQQLFLTAKMWYSAYHRKCPTMKHVWFGTILGEDGKAIKTRSGDSIKLLDLIEESSKRSLEIISEKSKDLSNFEKEHIAKVLGTNSIKYADLSSNRTGDYIFSWDKMLSFDGNTAAYLMYASARIKSILRKCDFDTRNACVESIETKEERNLIRKLIDFSMVLNQSEYDLRPHHICGYLFELAGEYSTFYKANRIIGESCNVTMRRLTIIIRTLNIIEAGMYLLGIQTIEKM